MNVHVASLSHDDIIQHYPELLANEVAFEEEASNIAKDSLERAIASRGLADASPTAKRGLKGCVSGTAALIDGWVEAQSKLRRKSPVLANITAMDSEQLGYLISRTLLNATLAGDIGFTNICVKAGQAVKTTMEYGLFMEAHPALAKQIDKQLSTSTSQRHKGGVFRAAMRSADFEGIKWDVEQQGAVGCVLVNAFIDATGLYEKVTVKRGKSTTSRLVATPTMDLLLAEADVLDSLLVPYHYPMVIPPKPWSGLYDGGYVNQHQHPLVMVKVRRQHNLRQLEAVDLRDAEDAINAIQATPWRINVDVLEVFEAIHNDGHGVAKTAPCTIPDIPEKPWGEMSAEEWAKWRIDPANAGVLKEWKAKAKEAYHVRSQWQSQRLIQQQQVKLAQRFEREPVMYYPHAVDFRGRIYPAAGLGVINPQGNDSGKALLEFARGKALGPSGGRWLAIHLANTWGYDKVSMDDREMWARINSERICEMVMDPTSDLWWGDADKPWQFLAACFEWSGYCEQGDEFVSHIPIAMDGSCSGLQHFAAMLLDQKTAEATNVVQVGRDPSDVYSVVLNKTQTMLAQQSDDLALEWTSRLRRIHVKPPVMTTPYGVSYRGKVDQITHEATKLIKKGAEPFSVKPFEAAQYLAPMVDQAIGEETGAARVVMDWLTAIARITAKADFPIRWPTPIGFLVIQDYRKMNGKRVEVRWAGTVHKMTLGKQTTQLDRRRQATGLAPNYVHSMDACHLMITVNNCENHDIKDFAMIHDSFAVHAADTGTLNAVLRECFVAMYSGNVLEDFYLGLKEQVSEEVFEKLPPPPERGDLDLTLVRDSEYFFA